MNTNLVHKRRHLCLWTGGGGEGGGVVGGGEIGSGGTIHNSC